MGFTNHEFASSSRGSGSSDGGSGGTGGSVAGPGSGGDITVGIGSGGSQIQVTCPTYAIEVVDGLSAPVDCEAMVSGSSVNAAWVVDISGIAGVDANGIVSATGKQGGEIKLRASFNGLMGEVKLTVSLRKLANPANVGPNEQGTLKGVRELRMPALDLGEGLFRGGAYVTRLDDPGRGRAIVEECGRRFEEEREVILDAAGRDAG